MAILPGSATLGNHNCNLRYNTIKLFKVILLSAAILAFTLFLLAALMIMLPQPAAPIGGVSGSILISDVNVVDVETGQVIKNRYVLVNEGLITDISPQPGAEAQTVIDGTGRYLLPGLWDMHTHTTKLAPHYQHPLFIANGVTGIRDMWGCMSEPDSFFACTDDRRAWNRALDRKHGLAPRYISHSSFQINGGNEVPEDYPAFFRVANDADAKALAAFYADAGADFLKVYSQISAESYHHLATHANAQGLTLAGHRPLQVSLTEALKAKQRSIEHARLFLFECFQDAATFRGLADQLAAYTPSFKARLVDEQDPELCAGLMEEMADSQTWWTPTLQTLAMGARAADPEFRNDPRLRYIPGLYQHLMWAPDADRQTKDAIDASGRNVPGAMYNLALQQVNTAQELGVKILAGTDTFDTYIFPGFAIHDELQALVIAGLSPGAALQTATISAARFNSQDAEFGSIAVGKQADMLLLDANPLSNIDNTRRIHALFFNGNYYDREFLDNLLTYAEERAGSLQNNLQIFWRAINSPLLMQQFAD